VLLDNLVNGLVSQESVLIDASMSVNQAS